jgi:hypothetical protein
MDLLFIVIGIEILFAIWWIIEEVLYRKTKKSSSTDPIEVATERINREKKKRVQYRDAINANYSMDNYRVVMLNKLKRKPSSSFLMFSKITCNFLGSIVYIYNIGVGQREVIKKSATLQEYLFKIDLKLDIN